MLLFQTHFYWHFPSVNRCSWLLLCLWAQKTWASTFVHLQEANATHQWECSLCIREYQLYFHSVCRTAEQAWITVSTLAFFLHAFPNIFMPISRADQCPEAPPVEILCCDFTVSNTTGISLEGLNRCLLLPALLLESLGLRKRGQPRYPHRARGLPWGGNWEISQEAWIPPRTPRTPGII